VKYSHPKLDQAVSKLVDQIQEAFPHVPNARWVALRLLDGDERIIRAVEEGELGELSYTRDDLEGVGVTRVSQKSGFAQ
jgi:ferrous iron transport protein B